MTVPSATELFDRVRSLPAAVPLLERIGPDPPVHLIGGAVRDLLMGGAPTDLDLIIEGDPADLASGLGGETRSYDRFGTATVVLDGHNYDLARARRETYARPGALPDVEPATLGEDLLRRDFTVNAAAIALNGATPGELRSAPSALEDLDRRQLRVLHARSFVDDPTRLLRLARYAARLSFGIEAYTDELARVALQDDVLATISGSRIGNELRLLAREADPIAAFRALHALGADDAIEPGFGLDDPLLAEAALDLLPADGRRDRLALAVVVRRLAAARRTSLLDAMAFEAGDRDAITVVATRAEPVAKALAQARRPSQIADAVADGPPELVALAGALGPAAPAREWLERHRHLQLAIDGSDLLVAGVPQGPAIGEGLRAARAAKLDGRVNGPEQELAEALRATR